MATGRVTVAAVDKRAAAGRQQDNYNRSLQQAAEFQARTDDRANQVSLSQSRQASEAMLRSAASNDEFTRRANASFLRERLDNFKEVKAFEIQQFKEAESLKLQQDQERSAQENRVSAVMQNLRNEIAENNLQQIQEISNTAQKFIGARIEEFTENQQKIGMAEGLQEGFGVTEEDIANFGAMTNALDKAAVAEGKLNEGLAQVNIAQAEDQRIKSPLFGGARAKGRAIGRAKAAAGNWTLAMDTFLNSSAAIIPDPETGELVSPQAMAARGPAGVQAALQAGTAMLMKHFKLDGLNPIILAEHLTPQVQGVNNQMALNLLTTNRKREQDERREEVMQSILPSLRGMDTGDSLAGSKFINDQVAALEMTGMSRSDANKMVIGQALDAAVGLQDPELLNLIAAAYVDPENPHLGSWEDRYDPMVKEAAAKLEQVTLKDEQEKEERVEALIPKIKLQRDQALIAAGTDEKKIATIHTEYRGRLFQLQEAGSLKAGQELAEESSKSLYSSEYIFQAQLRQFQETGALPSDTELQEMATKGMLTTAEAKKLSDLRGPDRGQELVKDNNSVIEKMATQVFTTEIVQKAGINSLQKLGGKGTQATETLGNELRIHMTSWANSQENPPSMSQWTAELTRRAYEVVKDARYAIKTKKSETLGSNFQRETIFVDLAGDLGSRIKQVQAENKNSPTGKSRDRREDPPSLVPPTAVETDILLQGEALDREIEALKSGGGLSDRTVALSKQTGVPADVLVERQARLSGVDPGDLSTSPARVRYTTQAAISPTEASVIRHPNMPKQRISRAYARLQRLAGFRQMREEAAKNRARYDSTAGMSIEDRTEGGTVSLGAGALMPVLDLIAVGEAGKDGYNAFNRGKAGDSVGQGASLNIKNRTVGEVMELQRSGGLNAVGRYQFIATSLKAAVKVAGVSLDDKFDEATQDRIASSWILNGQRPRLSAYIRGQSNDLNGALDDAANEWAALSDSKGNGRLNGLAGNKNTIGTGRVRQALQQARKSYMEAKYDSPSADGMATVVDVGEMLQRDTGLRVAEHPHFGPVGGHAKDSLHYSKRAIDITDHRRPNEPKSVWVARKVALEKAWRPIADKYGIQLIGPHSDPKGHPTHIHLGFPKGNVPRAALILLRRAEREVLKQHPLRG